MFAEVKTNNMEKYIEKIYDIANGDANNLLKLPASTAICLFHMTSDKSSLLSFWVEFYLPQSN